MHLAENTLFICNDAAEALGLNISFYWPYVFIFNFIFDLFDLIAI